MLGRSWVTKEVYLAIRETPFSKDSGKLIDAYLVVYCS